MRWAAGDEHMPAEQRPLDEARHRRAAALGEYLVRGDDDLGYLGEPPGTGLVALGHLASVGTDEM
jgi:hypothetical protein